MGRWERISERVAALSENEREAVLDALEALLDEDAPSDLTDEQWAEIDRRIKEPGPTVPHEAVVAWVASLGRD
jgi:hypothetical protein